MECFIAQAAVSQFAKMLIMDYLCALFECGCLVRWGYIIVTVYKGRHCNRKISCSSPFAPTCHVSATHTLRNAACHSDHKMATATPLPLASFTKNSLTQYELLHETVRGLVTVGIPQPVAQG